MLGKIENREELQNHSATMILEALSCLLLMDVEQFHEFLFAHYSKTFQIGF